MVNIKESDDYEKLKQLNLVVKCSVDVRITFHFDEQLVSDLQLAAVPTALYALTHKITYHILSNIIGQIKVVQNHKVNAVMMIRSHLRMLPVIITTLTKQNKDFLCSERDTFVIIVIVHVILLSDFWLLKTEYQVLWA